MNPVTRLPNRMCGQNQHTTIGILDLPNKTRLVTFLCRLCINFLTLGYQWVAALAQPSYEIVTIIYSPCSDYSQQRDDMNVQACAQKH